MMRYVIVDKATGYTHAACIPNKEEAEYYIPELKRRRQLPEDTDLVVMSDAELARYPYESEIATLKADLERLKDERDTALSALEDVQS